MIGMIRSTTSAQARRMSGRTTRVEGKSDAHDAGDRPTQNREKALVPLDPQAPRTGGFGRPQHSAPFIAQLAAVYLAAPADADRRVRRDPQSVAPRATVTYRAARAMTSVIEPGFLVRREC